ncbi:PREDICTED: regulator of microtubule dynamics protein 2-like [Dinoponera quadriceps]|uniref:Regulator of microtubule dynamics protein 1 n=1 Tax=Dinoponera quadriceps TaxID=609295 RepID=A0A6P3Y542_DINQU|nr:PREDICTED: regulator of microtubule dynamics protein 2-like [Dinoponera quadriceps]
MSQLQTNLIAAAIGATIGVISAASIFIYHKILENKQRPMMNENYEELSRRLTELQEELEALRLQQNQQRKKKLSRKRVPNDNTFTATDNDTDMDAFSTAGTDVGNDEFFDCSDSENGISDIETRSTEATCPGLDFTTLDTHIEQEEFQKDIYLELQNLVNTYPNNIDIAWRFAKSCFKHSNDMDDQVVKGTILLEGINACKRFLTSSNADLHKWYAILIGVHSNFLSIKEKIQSGFEYRIHIMKALEIRPNDGMLHHLLGRCLYEFAKLSWVERKVVTTLYSEPPNVSYKDALDNFEKAETFSDKVNLENQLYISKCYIAISNYEQAIHWLEKICDPLQVAANKEEEKIQDEAHNLLNKYSVYKKDS